MQETPSSLQLSPGFRHLWRAHFSARGIDNEFTVFVRAVTQQTAHRNICNVVNAICPYLSPDDLDESYYNLTSAKDLAKEGLSIDIDHRLFETGWQGNRVTNWVEQPVFAVSAPAALFAAWSQARSMSSR
ncbi:MAG: hypothetical protein EPN74_02030 [Rhodanobacter sp.]|nr:MAG: hypothetical protein EPN74_02030 [Rhodanobacter sp.]